MLCPNCGADVGDSIRLCEKCEARKNRPETEEPVQPESIQPEEVALEPALPPAGFWLRLFAFLIDLSLTNLVGMALLSVLGTATDLAVPGLVEGEEGVGAALLAYFGANLILLVAPIFIHWLYYAAMESSPLRATFGKHLFGLVVTDLDGARVSFSRASARYFATAISWLTLGLGFVMAGTTERKQALHDKLAGSLVVRREQYTRQRVMLSAVCSVLFFLVTQTLLTIEQWKGAAREIPRPISVPRVQVPRQPERPTADRGSVIIGTNALNLSSAVALWDEDNHVLELRFFERETAVRNEAHYPVRMRFTVAPGERGLERESLVACEVLLRIDDKERAFPCEESGETQSELPYLGGILAPGDTIFGLAKGGGIVSGEGAHLVTDIRWSLEFNTLVRDSEQYNVENLVLDQRRIGGSSAVVSKYDPLRASLGIAFLRGEPSLEERYRVRDENSFVPLRESGLNAELFLTFPLGSRRLTPSDIQGYELTVYDGDRRYAIEPSMVDRDRSRFELVGTAEEGQAIAGRFEGVALVAQGGRERRISWLLPFTTTIIDVDVRSAGAQPIALMDASGYLKVESEPYELKSNVAFYYPKSNRVEIGFYRHKLSAEEREVIAHNRSLTAPVNEKRANLILSMRFAPGVEQASVDEIIEANIYVIRDPLGGFYFPGQYERRSIERSRAELAAGELRRLSGNLGAGEEVSAILKGEDTANVLRVPFQWKADFRAVLVEVP